MTNVQEQKGNLLFEGSFSKLFESSENSQFLVKESKSRVEQAIKEYEILKKLQNFKGFPKVGSPLQKLQTKEHHSHQHQKIECETDDSDTENKSSETSETIHITFAFLIEKLDYSLADLMKIRKNGLSNSTIAFIIKEVIKRLETLHDQKVIHKDLKPENIMFKREENETLLFLIDFNLSEEIQETKNKEFKQQQQHSQQLIFKGNLIYSSINQMECQEKISFLDDLESFVYILYELVSGERLPWSSRKFSWMNVWEMKNNFSSKLLDYCSVSGEEKRNMYTKLHTMLKMIETVRRVENNNFEIKKLYKLIMEEIL